MMHYTLIKYDSTFSKKYRNNYVARNFKDVSGVMSFRKNTVQYSILVSLIFDLNAI